MATVRSLIKIGLADHGRRMTMDEFLDAEEDPHYLYELARGVLEVSEVPNDPQGEIIHEIHTAFVVYGLAHPGLIRWIGHGSDIRLRLRDAHGVLRLIGPDGQVRSTVARRWPDEGTVLAGNGRHAGGPFRIEGRIIDRPSLRL